MIYRQGRNNALAALSEAMRNDLCVHRPPVRNEPRPLFLFLPYVGDLQAAQWNG